jgi:hypothetical protein
MGFLSKFFKETLQDNTTGKYSHAKIIAMIAAVAAPIYMWKLIIIGGMTIEYFVAYLTWCTSHQTINKYLDVRKGVVSQNEENKLGS